VRAVRPELTIGGNDWLGTKPPQLDALDAGTDVVP
jgi:hypothetical protein